MASFSDKPNLPAAPGLIPVVGTAFGSVFDALPGQGIHGSAAMFPDSPSACTANAADPDAAESDFDFAGAWRGCVAILVVAGGLA